MKSYLIIVLISILLTASMAMAYEYNGEVSLSLSEEYNDNIFLGHSNRIDDFITYISPGIGLTVRSQTSNLRLAYNPTFSYYNSHNELNETAHHFTANGNFNVSERLNLILADTYVQSSETSDIITIPDLGPITRRVERRYNSANINLSYRLTENLDYTLGTLYSYIDYKEPGFNEVKTYSGNMGLTYRLNENTTLLANARFSKYDYRFSSDAVQQDYIVGITYRFTPTFNINLKGGAVITKIEDTNESNTGYEGSIIFTKTFESGSAALSLIQGVSAGIDYGEPLKYRSISLSLLKAMTNKWIVSISTSYNNYKSVETNNTDAEDISISTDLTYRLSPWANLILSYSYIDHDDQIMASTSYNNNTILLKLELTHSRRL